MVKKKKKIEGAASKLASKRIAKAVKRADRQAAKPKVPTPAQLVKKKKRSLATEIAEAITGKPTKEEPAPRRVTEAERQRAEGKVKAPPTLQEMAKATVAKVNPKQLKQLQHDLQRNKVDGWPRRVDSTRWLAMDQQRNVRLVLARSYDEVFYISFEESLCTIKREELSEFQRYFAPYPYDLKLAGQKMLNSIRFTSISDPARKELESLTAGQPSPLQQEIMMTIERLQEKAIKKQPKGKKAGKGKQDVVTPPTVSLGRDLAALKGNAGREPPKAGHRTRQPGSGARIRDLLMEGGHTPTDIIKVIRKEFPSSKASEKDVAWNRNHLMNKLGKTPPPYPGDEPAKPEPKLKVKKAKPVPNKPTAKEVLAKKAAAAKGKKKGGK